MERERPNEPDILTLKGTLLSGRKDYAGARAAYEQALARNPEKLSAGLQLFFRFAGLETMLMSLEEAARSLGGTWWYSFRRVVLPLLYRGIAAGALLLIAGAGQALAPAGLHRRDADRNQQDDQLAGLAAAQHQSAGFPSQSRAAG
jgi:hypothetical protein